ncbi:MAG: signal recognition particle-docking protein FtsY [Gammaproteobacteria bacterium RIFCSPHIGHO2_02_FULL_39_13]|nr:MAG: signal recognition particle-docking protein FtsY [Gammaproteobacteria bacterium RIFCSPHIGHO2_02_FULL_39_13]OGT48985.1 MAG: signal recognition particle-docking protein FtsY [Gammaproteobacteria bacterium RIFCSPHIGHO2_12_FULL_39_24]
MFQFLKSTSEPSWFGRLADGLKRTRKNFSDRLANLILGKKTIDAELLESLETILLSADIGIESTNYLLKKMTEKVDRKQLSDPTALIASLKAEMIDLLKPYEAPLIINQKPFVILMVGMNGAGKTTSIAKLAHYYKTQGKTVMLAAGDTFRAAAIDQLQVWGERNHVTVIAQQPGADSASVIYDALQSAIAKNYDILIADTAGRLHTQSHLMSELKKIKRVMQKMDVNYPHETMLIVDAGIGQNALIQAKEFHDAIGLNGISVTKLDGTARGGMVFAITQKTQLPIRFIGVGEQLDDLKPFVAHDFVEALFGE